MGDLVNVLLPGVLLFNFVILIIILDNRRFLPSLGRQNTINTFPRVSILVPARNEAQGIAACLNSLARQDYPEYEILVLDDFSSDATGKILAGLSEIHPQLSLVPARPLPDGWLGKNWACHQLAAAANGELLFFTDADTIHHSRSLVDGVALLSTTQAAMVSALPKEEVLTWAEKLTIPVLVWILAAVLPHRLAQKFSTPQLSGAIGQYLLFTRRAYDEIGGHQAIRDKVADDLVLARRIKSGGLGWMLANGSRRVHCRMYTSWNDVRDGLGKNLFAVFEHRILPYTFAWLWLLTTTWLPLFVAVFVLLSGPIPLHLLLLSAVSILVSLSSWWLVLKRFSMPSYLALLHPIILLVSAYLAARSVVQFWRGNAVWKGRSISGRALP